VKINDPVEVEGAAAAACDAAGIAWRMQGNTTTWAPAWASAVAAEVVGSMQLEELTEMLRAAAHSARLRRSLEAAARMHGGASVRDAWRAWCAQGDGTL